MKKTTVYNRRFTKNLIISAALLLVFSKPGLPQVYLDSTAAVADRVEDLLQRMTLDEKIGQMTQVDRRYLKNESDIATFFLGSLLSGGGSAPTDNSPKGWADMYDRYQSIALQTRLKIPLLYGIDAVHGHNNVKGAVIFPHNIGLGCTRNPDLVEQVARITALEVAGTGIDWTFAPCIAVPRDERWGRTYEGFGETPELAQLFGAAAVRGFQGGALNLPGSILACAKHYVGDGGTTGGVDQGNTQIDEATLRAIHLPGYQAAIANNVATIMASYNSWNGEKIHGHKYLLTEVLKEELGFRGFVVSDWAAIDQLPGDYTQDVEMAINAGIDMVMVPERYELFISTLKSLVTQGKVTMNRINDAVRRILTKKFEAGLFEHPYTNRSLTDSVGSVPHRTVARQAVRESLVLLKKKDGILPLPKENVRIHVAGKNADNLGYQCGGWTISWQGGSGDITEGTTILEGLRQVAPGASITFSQDGSGAAAADVGIVVIGETPYAEGGGDRKNLSLSPEDIRAVRTVKKAGIPTIVILVSGRPLILSPILHFSDVLIAAWLPGSEGQGVADVLFGDYQPRGRLSHSWPRSMEQIPINVGDSDYDPLFPYDFGLQSLADSPVGSAPEVHSAVVPEDGRTVEITFNKTIVMPLPAANTFSVHISQQNVLKPTAVQLKAGDATTLVLTLPEAVTQGDQVSLTFSGGEILSQDNGRLAEFGPVDAYNMGSEVAALPRLPGKIEAEEWVAMSGVQTEATSDIGGGLNVGWIDTNDWMEYDVVVEQSGEYELSLRVASLAAGGSVLCSASAGGAVIINFPPTGGWQNWTTVKASISLTSGRQMVRLKALKGGFNINWMQFELITDVPEEPENSEKYSFTPAYPNPFRGRTHIRFPVQSGQKIVLAVFNLLGQRVYSWQDRAESSGQMITAIDLHKNPPGIYFLRFQADGRTFHQKLIQMR